MANTPRVPLSNGPRTVMEQINLRNAQTGRPTGALGVFAAQPFMSPKYARHRPQRNHEFEETMARMFIKVAPDLYNKFVASLEDAETRRIAKVIAGDDNNKGGHGYIDFLLQNAQHSFEEKFQVVETLSDSYVAFFFGHAPPMFQYRGILMNTYQDDWTMRMFRIFRDLARGTQLARHNLILRLKYDSMIVSGAMTAFTWSTTAGQETWSPFSFNLLVKSIHIIYGSLAPPTRFHREGSFTPQGFQLENSGVGNTNASQTYLGNPPVQPPGIFIDPAFYSVAPEDDPTGTSDFETPPWQEENNDYGNDVNTETVPGEVTEGFDFT